MVEIRFPPDESHRWVAAGPTASADFVGRGGYWEEVVGSSFGFAHPTPHEFIHLWNWSCSALMAFSAAC